MTQRFIFSLALLLGISCSLLAQPLSGSSNFEQLLASAELASEANNYYRALEKYEEAYEKRDEDSLALKIAYLNYQLRDYAAANRTYRRLFRRIDGGDPTYNKHRLYYGQALKAEGQYDDALMLLLDYLNHETDDNLRTLAQMEITGAELGQNLPENTSEVTVEGVGRRINGLFSEYSPSLSEDGKTLYYSTWTTSEVVDLEAMNEEENVSRIFMSVQNDEGEWERPEPLGVEVNRPQVHTANPAVSPDGRRLFYNRLILQGNKPVDARIYMSDVDDTGWKSGNELTSLGGGEYLALQPNVGELFGGEVLFFVSDMDGGFGGLDIYYAPHRGEGVYGTPINLGPTVNTAGDDITPFFFDGTLYYATNGLPTIGGHDIYYTVWDGSEWSTPEHMGGGFNSPADDQSFKLYGEGYVGFLTSNREGGRSIKSKTCCDDIYGFEIARIYSDLVVGLFTEDRENLFGGEVRLEPLVNNEIVPGGDTQSKDSGNRYDFGLELEYDYMVIGSHPEYYPDTFYFNTKGLEESRTTTHRFYLKAKPKPEPEPEFDTIYIEEAIVLENILFDFNRSNIRPDAEPDLQVLQGWMEEYPDMVIELSSHTDVRGGDAANQQLSQRRANSTKRWLVQNGGISSSRMTTVGFGETVPKVVDDKIARRFDWLNEGDVLTEDFINALPADLQEDAHELNRRTEFRILEGPTSIIIRRDILERKPQGSEEAPERNSQPTLDREESGGLVTRGDSLRARQYAEMSSRRPPVQVAPSWTPPAISPMSSLNRETDLTGVPILQFEKREVNLGTVTRGDTREMVFRFTNVGRVPAKVMLIQACECTTTEHNNRNVYEPGESGEIRAVFDSSSKDEAETISIDIFLEQTDSRDTPIVEELRYSFEIQ